MNAIPVSDLSAKERALLRGIALGLHEFEPFPAFLAPSSNLLENLVRKGFVEQGESNRPAVSERGYRLTSRGWAVVGKASRPALLVD